MLTNPFIRLGIGMPIAILVVLGLFHFMRLAISQNFEEPDDKAQRTLEAITPQQDSQDVRRTQRSKPRKLDAANKPPPPPKLATRKSDIDLPAANISGAAPTDVNFARLDTMSLGNVSVSDRDAQPIRPPTQTYPQRAAERQIEGSCDVRLDVDVRGRPYNVEAECTDNIFKRAAERDASRAEFAPKIVNGVAVERRGVVYPFIYQMAE
ncbi:MAG: energy transducer TonB [Pseudomonadota bacterium]